MLRVPEPEGPGSVLMVPEGPELVLMVPEGPGSVLMVPVLRVRELQA